MNRFIPVLVFVIVLVTTPHASARTWTDDTGKNSVEADLVGLDGDVVSLKKADGSIVKLSMARLSQRDQDFVRLNANAIKESQSRTAGPQTSTTATEGSIKVEVVSLSLNKPLPENKEEKQIGFTMMSASMGMPGMRIGLLLTDRDRNLVRLDESKSTIRVCKDDQGNSLLADKNSQSNSFFGGPISSLQVLPKGHTALVELQQPKTPVAGAKSVQIIGELLVQCGTGEKIEEQKNVNLKSKSNISVGGLSFSVQTEPNQSFGSFSVGPLSNGVESNQDSGSPKMTISLTTNGSLASVKRFEFLDTASGIVIPSNDAGSSASGFSGKMTEQRSFGLKQEVDRVNIRLVLYEKLVPVKVPLDLTLGIGF